MIWGLEINTRRVKEVQYLVLFIDSALALQVIFLPPPLHNNNNSVFVRVCVCVCVCVGEGVCVYVCVLKDACMHACIYVCLHACIYVCLHACMYACMCAYLCARMHAYMQTYVYVSKCAQITLVQAHANIHACVCVCVFVLCPHKISSSERSVKVQPVKVGLSIKNVM